MNNAILIVGRFSGFHRGHLELIKTAHIQHPECKIVIGIIVGKKSSLDFKKNPFSFDERKESILTITNKLNIPIEVFEFPNAYLPDIVNELKTHDLDVKYVYCGNDRLAGYIEQNLDALGIKVIYLERNENDADITKHTSATKLRDTIKTGDFKSFETYMPAELDDATLKKIWSLLRNSMSEKGLIQSSIITAGISHLEDLDPKDFIKMLRDFYKSNIIAIQKLDGTFNLSIVKDDDEIKFARLSKKQTDFFDSDSLPKLPMFNALRSACSYIENDKKVEQILLEVLDNGDAIDIEVLYGEQPNTIMYNTDRNYLALLRYITGKSGDEAEDNLDNLYDKLKNLSFTFTSSVYEYNWESESIQQIDQEETWEFTKPEKLDKLKYKLDIEKDLDELEDWLNSQDLLETTQKLSLTNFEILTYPLSKIKIKDRPWFKEIKENTINRALEHKLNIKQKMIDVILKNLDFKIGGKNQEGLVIRDIETNEMTKLIDKNDFTQQNKTNWKYMELADSGIKYEGRFYPGVLSKLFDSISGTLNIPQLKLRNVFFKKFSSYSGNDTLSDIIKYVESSNIPTDQIEADLILIKTMLYRSAEKIKKLKNAALEDPELSKTFKNRTSNSLGIINTSIKNTILDIKEIRKNDDSNNIKLAKLLFALRKNFMFKS